MNEYGSEIEIVVYDSDEYYNKSIKIIEYKQ